MLPFTTARPLAQFAPLFYGDTWKRRQRVHRKQLAAQQAPPQHEARHGRRHQLRGSREDDRRERRPTQREACTRQQAQCISVGVLTLDEQWAPTGSA